jgi:hypothetical protein
MTTHKYADTERPHFGYERVWTYGFYRYRGAVALHLAALGRPGV